MKDFGLDTQSLIGQSHLDFLPRLVQTQRSRYEQVLQGQFLKSPEETWLLEDGQPICVRWAMQPWFTLEQKIGGIMIVVQEISELVAAREAALEMAQTKSRFLANISHEIRTPMNGVIGMTDLLVHTFLDRRQKDFVTTLKTCGKNLMLLIDDILDFSKLEAGQLNLEIKPFNIFDCLAQVKKVLDSQAYKKRIELQISIEQDTPTIVKGDPNRLAQILLNLVGNGIKFTEKGKVSLRVRPQNINNGHITLYFEIIDTGIGIALQEQERLFQSFSQIDSSSTRQYGGTGLGLAISKQLVSLMAGQIGVLSQLNKGSTFWFTVNLELVDATNPPYLSPIYLNDISNSLIPDVLTDTIQQLNVLIIDRPSSPTYFQLTQNLELWQMSWQQTTNESQAINFLEQETFDLVLWDLDTLSAGKGRNLIHHLQPIPCVLLASLSQYLEVRTLLNQGINQYLLKPINPNILVNTILLTLEGQNNNSDRDQTVNKIPEYSQDLRLLVVEDTAVNRKVVGNLLSLLNIQADFATNGAEAFSKVQKSKYNVILMDCLMPVMDGYEATRLIRSQEQSTNEHIVIIAMTANAMKGDREKCLQSGMDDYITKPLNLQKLSAVLNTWDKEKNSTIKL
ncbi:MAG: response regulator [Synechococcaceae cyanobacterium RL_1_2]|nr:response regulator [Synechococcaceae cyanobacterium RL_1_2]